MRTEFWKLGLLGSLLVAGTAWAAAPIINNTNVPDAAPWVEDQTEKVAPAFTRDHLIPLDMPRHVSLKVGIDPDTITVGTDRVVRYVVVMTNSGGSTMASYEGIRCDSREVKTYARQNSSGQWSPVREPVWQNLNATMPSHHAQIFARQGACQDGVTQSKSEILDTMKNGRKTPNDLRAN